MSIFENLSNSADKGTEASKELVSKSYEYSKLKAFQITTLSISMLAKLLIIGTVLSLGFIFIAFSGAIALGTHLQNMALGYLAVGSGTLIFAFLLYLFRKSFDKKIIAKISEIFFK
ncbi:MULTISPECIES: hypothetical protein [unclassified Polaribacter]|uniref:hypothetical protein n=1 Tax=unclassified Polaribacter TaxID=196858 RepID=UPI0011BECB3D|nr:MULTISPECIES: hypothetical protein [unclassified Polaribacter]TXD50924.1 hypothetical protein ES043_14135 [Polaribacter sp. IC063]TXD62283.1 hypothetical protein ES044_01935 [Polaribacter sp. IC066]